MGRSLGPLGLRRFPRGLGPQRPQMASGCLDHRAVARHRAGFGFKLAYQMFDQGDEEFFAQPLFVLLYELANRRVIRMVPSAYPPRTHITARQILQSAQARLTAECPIYN